MQNHRNPRYERAIARGRAIVTDYASQSGEFGDDPSELLGAAGDVIGDVLAFATTLPADAVPNVYGGSDVERVGSLAGCGTVDALILLDEDPDRLTADPQDISTAEAAFGNYLAIP